MKNYLKLFYGLFVLFFLALTVVQVTGISVAAAVGVTATLTLIRATFPAIIGVAMADPIVTLFATDIAKNIFPNNEFYKQSRDDSKYLDGKTVTLPQSGTKPGITKNPSVFPLTAGKREDDSLAYNIDAYAVGPIHIQDTEEIVISYSKRMDVLGDHIDSLNTRFANESAYVWAPTVADNIFRTTDATTRAPITPGATGTRKRINKNDILKASTILNRMDVPVAGRCLLITADMLEDILLIPDFVQADKMGGSEKSALVEGAIGRILGFAVYMRSNTVLFDNSATPVKKAVGAAGAIDDSSAALFWHPSFVRRAEGGVKVYSDLDNPLYLGSVFSAEARYGGTFSRKDQKGIVALVETYVL
jgi:hypothetical protein